MAKVVDSAPGHVVEVRRLVFDPLTKAQQRQLREICRRIVHAIDPDDACVDDPMGMLARATDAATGQAQVSCAMVVANDSDSVGEER